MWWVIDGSGFRQVYSRFSIHCHSMLSRRLGETSVATNIADNIKIQTFVRFNAFTARRSPARCSAPAHPGAHAARAQLSVNEVPVIDALCRANS